jgi:hypothetical protein
MADTTTTITAAAVPDAAKEADGVWGFSRAQLVALGILVVFLAVSPFVLYPVFLMKLLCFALFACAFNLLIGYVGLLSFGHAAYFGMGGYLAGHAAKVWGLTPELAIIAGAITAGLLSSSVADAADVGMSYGAVAVLGTFTAAIPSRWRAMWAGWWTALAAWAIAAARSPISTAPGHPAITAARIAAGSSVRGLSSVTTTRSASRMAIPPIMGRFAVSRSPPQPNTTHSRPAAWGRRAVSTVSSALGLCA